MNHEVFLILMIFAWSLSVLSVVSDSSFAHLPPESKKIQDEYFNEEFGFGLTLPEDMKGFLAEMDNSRTGKSSMRFHLL